ncbi:MAG: FAD-dependent oxidoreductase [Acidobacteriaceae bacterium]
MAQILVIGGGFFGMYLADHFARHGCSVRLVEKGDRFMSRASFANQARVHNGYHYPRSILTALRSRISFPRFVQEFRECVDSEFEMYYLIGRPLGKITGKQFEQFCSRIGGYCKPAPERIRKLTNPLLIEACFSTVEYAFDSVKLCEVMKQRLDTSGVVVSLSTTAVSVGREVERLRVELCASGSKEIVYVDHVFNCTYSRINQILNSSSMQLIPLKHELTEMCLVDVPEVLKKTGITVMCGPFFSVMPFPSAALHSFSHVRYTPHYEWSDGGDKAFVDAHAIYDTAQRNSAWNYMQKDAARYMPILAECEYRRSIWEVKTVLPRSASDDSRPILFLPNYGLKGFHITMGGKIDNVYDVVEALDSYGLV